MRRAFTNAVAGQPSASCRGIASYGPARAQLQAVNAQQQPQDPSLSLSPHSELLTNGERASPRSRNEPVPEALSKTYFDSTGVRWVGIGGKEPSDPNKAKLGKTLRILQERLPTLLQSPLPQSLLAPNISLHLFPSTHPHLPTVSGRVAYTAALWSSPIAWNRVPIIGNVQLEILAERMTAEPLTFLPRRPEAIPEQLVVRWCEKRKAKKDGEGETRGFASALNLGGGVDSSKAFSGLFIFDFDKEGRILSHTIETAQQGGNWEKGYGAKFVGLTDWLLGGMRDPGETSPVFQQLLKPGRRVN
ncbi:hypothetical protein NLU13_3441 [Sarocladium strictum]|uniref:Uncharacterized protein n=1 Tax=Sarocladium strictum TaxID=5046 RepID=A0AA39LAA8_SARSR|nr:hypothetical protein NLU13_3441 [Sarocladium strictum]